MVVTGEYLNALWWALYNSPERQRIRRMLARTAGARRLEVALVYYERG